MGSEGPFSTVQPRPPRYNKKTARSMSMPSGHPIGSATGDGSGRKHPADGGSVGSVASSRSNGSGSRAREGRIRGERTGGGATMSVGSSRSGSERSR